MVGWLDFFGKLIEYVAKKLLDKTIHPASPCRKAACQAFVRLFDSIVTIEYLTKDFLCVIKKDIESESRSHIDKWLKYAAEELDQSSDEFLESVAHVTGAVALYDSDLSKLLGNVVRGKKGLLLVSTFPELHKHLFLRAEEPGVISFTKPDNSLSNIEIEIYYEDLKNKRLKLPSTEWPNGVIGTLIERHVIKAIINEENSEELLLMADSIERHLQVLKEARQAIAKFIRTEFSIEDLLFVTKK